MLVVTDKASEELKKVLTNPEVGNKKLIIFFGMLNSPLSYINSQFFHMS
jgi:hypothetical protein